MIYEIISKNDVPTSQMHIYLKNKTGDDGGIYPEIFHDLALKESVNGLYAFAIACVITNNFTDTSKFLKDYPSKEVATLGLIQYIKGMATTVQLNSQCVNPRYNNLIDIEQLGMSPTLLNLDGDLLYKHYDNTKYFSKEAADEAEDSFPYWVINTVKEIMECEELMKPTTKQYELPYYIQNISFNEIPIVNKINGTEGNIIGMIPPSGKEAVIGIKDGYGILGTAENAYIQLTDNIQPVKHMVKESELDLDVGTLKLPEGDFYVKCKKGTLICGGYGINNHYFACKVHSYTEGDIIHIKGLFHNAGIVDDGIYVQFDSNTVCLTKAPEDHTKKEQETPSIATGLGSGIPPIGPDCTYLVIIPMTSREAASEAIFKILKKSPYKNAYIDVDLDNKITIVVYGDKDSSNAIKVKKKILAVFGYKAMVIEYDKFYK